MFWVGDVLGRAVIKTSLPCCKDLGVIRSGSSHLLSNYYCWFVHTETISIIDISNISSQEWMLCRLHQTASTCHYVDGTMSFKPLQVLLMLSIKQIRVCYAYCCKYFWTGCWTRIYFSTSFVFFVLVSRKLFFSPFKRDKTIWEVTTSANI